MAASEQEPRLTGKLKRAFDEREVAQLWRALDDRRGRSRAPASSPRMWLAVAAAALAIGLLVLTLRHSHDAPLALKGARALPLELGSTQAATVYQLDDGSKIDTAKGAAIEVVRNDGSELVTVLRKGKTRFDVRPGGKRRWSIEAGLLSVQVLGTEFVVDRGEQTVSVQVRRGVVLVRGHQLPDGVRRLSAGESVVVAREAASAADAIRQADTSAASASASRHDEQPPAPLLSEQSAAERSLDEAGSPALSAGQAPATWWLLAARGDYAAARARIAAQGGMAAVARRTREPSRLLSLADVARKLGEPQAAIVPLEQLLAQAPHSPEATIAAFVLGKLELEVLKRPRAAVMRFNFVVSKGVTGALAEDALARLVDAHKQNGEPALARARAAEYLARYPQGRYEQRMKKEAELLP